MDKKSILITGCSSGIGYRVAHDLHNAGYRVFATARKAEDVERLSAEGLESLLLDVTKSETVDAALQEIALRTGGTLYALFNNAGYGQPGALEDLSSAALKEQFETNVFGLHDVTVKVMKIMRAQGYGRIMHNSSVLGLVSLRFRGAYNASKYAIEALADTMRLELEGSAIFMSLIEPGPITSGFRDNAYSKFRKHVRVQESFFYHEYQKSIARFEGEAGKDPFELPPSAVTVKVRHALESNRPKPHYYVTVPAYLFAFLKRLLPSSWLDRILLKIA